MNICDLIPDRYYLIISDYGKYYIKYKFIYEHDIYYYGFEIRDTGLGYLRYYTNSHVNTTIINGVKEYVYCGIDWLENKNFFEIDISEIVKYLPDNNPDRISYYRQEKIKSLLIK